MAAILLDAVGTTTSGFVKSAWLIEVAVMFADSMKEFRVSPCREA